MLDPLAVQLALRTHALALSVATTGSVTLAATATGYTRSSGSFLTDGFAAGMEITADGFSAANNAASIVTAVTALVLTVDRALTAQTAASGRTIAAGLPSRRAWENVAFTPTVGAPYVEEGYTPGPNFQATLGPFGEIESRPLYTLRVFVPQGLGISAAGRYSSALLRHFAPRTEIVLGSGDVLRVRTDTGPYVGQLQNTAAGYASVPITVPLRLRTANSI
jgi:hypothetical protein